MSLVVTATQRANWDKLKATAHPSYAHVLAQGRLDNTTAARYMSLGKWAGLAYQWSGDPAFARRSYDHVKNLWPLKTFESAPLWKGNEIGEHATEMVATLEWIRAGLPAADVDAWRAWLVRMADAILLGAQRLNDSDLVVGVHFFLATLDRCHGTSYAAHPQQIAMRKQITYFCDVLAAGGDWCESLEYNLGTIYLLLNGAEAAGIEHYPEVVTFRESLARLLPHMFTPDFKDMFEWGDDQGPHDPRWLSLENIFATVGHYDPNVRALEETVRAVWKRPAGAPFYARYFVWADPLGARAPWQPAATFTIARGRGHVYARTGWGPTDTACMIELPTFSLGLVDHMYPTFGDFRVYGEGRWLVDRPIAYSGNLFLSNSVIVAGLGVPREVGAVTGATDLPNVLYASGVNAGPFADPGTAPVVPTLVHEHARSFFWLKDRHVWLILDRIHLAAVAGVEAYVQAAAKPTALASPLLQTIWQSQRALPPTVVAGVMEGDWRTTACYPATFVVVDQAALVGSIGPGERRSYVTVQPTTVAPFQVLATLYGDATIAIDRPAPEVIRHRVITPGFADVVIVSSARPGPPLVTSFTTNKYGGKGVAHDPTKLDGIQAARALEGDPAWLEPGVDVYVETGSALVLFGAATEATDREKLIAARAAIVTLTGEVARQEALVATGEAATEVQADRADAAETMIDAVREALEPPKA